ncbi:MAG: rod shape-determining protein MreD [Oscillospiraceae bacterium]|nr:rod shape-determining protein MreD [Oscillospiraceae bacterium]
MNQTYRLILKWLTYALVFAGLAVLQTGVMPLLTIAGVHPNLLALAPPMVAVLEGGVPGAMFGVVAGLCCDALLPPFAAVHTIYFFLSGLLVGCLSEALLKKNFGTAALSALASLTVLDVLLFALFFFIPRRAGFGAITQVLIPEVAFSALFTPLVYLPLRWVWRRRWTEWEEGEP